MNCQYHPDTPAVATCVACQQPICAQCREEVAGHPMCRPCVAASQAQLSQDAAPAMDAPARPVMGEQSLPPCGFPQYAKALLFSGIMAVICAVVWDKFVLWTGWSIGFLVIGFGIVIGVAVRMGAEGRPGKGLPWIGAAMTGLSVLLGYLLLADDQGLADGTVGARWAQVPFVFRLIMLIPAVVTGLSLMGWVFVGIGVWQGWSIPSQGNAASQAPPAAGGNTA